MNYSEQFLEACADQQVQPHDNLVSWLTKPASTVTDAKLFTSPFRQAITNAYVRAMSVRLAMLDKLIDLDAFPADRNLQVLARLANATTVDPATVTLQPLVPPSQQHFQYCHQAEVGWTKVNRMLQAFCAGEELPNQAGLEIYVNEQGEPIVARKAIDYATGVLLVPTVIAPPGVKRPGPPVLYPSASLVQVQARGDEALWKHDVSDGELTLDSPVVIRPSSDLVGLSYVRPLALGFPAEVRQEHFGTRRFVAACPTMEDLHANIVNAVTMQI